MPIDEHGKGLLLARLGKAMEQLSIAGLGKRCNAYPVSQG
jgi:hypothetical protein